MESRTERIPVTLENGAIIYVEATRFSGEEDVAFDVLLFEEVATAIEGIAATVTAALQKVRPHKATVEFGLELGVESGKLTSLLVKGTGKANLKIVLEWS